MTQGKPPQPLRTPRPCEGCGTMFAPWKLDAARFCCRECRRPHVGRRRRLPKTCVGCGDVFQPRTARQRFCTQGCANRYQADKQRGKPMPKRHVRQAAVCPWCKSAFERRPSAFKNMRGFCSQSCGISAAWAQRKKGPPPYKTGNAIGGRRADIGDIYFRSRWEANYARYLNWQIAHRLIERWEYEPDVFEFPVRRGIRSYTPDFKVWLDAERFRYDEVKGYMSPESRTKLSRMQRHYPHIVIRVIDHAAYRRLSADFARILPNWELAAKEARYGIPAKLREVTA